VTFNINQFKAVMDRHGGHARTNLFVVTITNQNVPGVITTEDLQFFCQSITVPGINLETMQYRPMGVGYSEAIPVSSTLATMNGVFLLDSNHRVLTFFHRWISSVVNVGSAPGRTGLRPREIEYKENYTTSLRIQHFSAHDTRKFYEYRFEGVYPTEVSGSELSWSSEAGPATVTVNFSYNRMIYSGFVDATMESSAGFRGEQKSIANGTNIVKTILAYDQRDIDRVANRILSA
jgi:hypothetical protein